MSSLHNRVYAPMLVGATLLIVIFFSRSVLSTYTAQGSELQTLQEKSTKLDTGLSTLAAIQEEFKGDANTPLKEKAQKYGQAFDEASILEALMITPPQVRPSHIGLYNLSIGSVSIDKGSVLPNGLSLATISVAVQARNLPTLLEYLTHLTQESRYAFTINDFSIPFDTNPEPTARTVGGSVYSLNLSLGMYYYDDGVK